MTQGLVTPARKMLTTASAEPRTQRVFERSKRIPAEDTAYSAALRARLSNSNAEPRTQRVFERSKRIPAEDTAYSAALRARLGGPSVTIFLAGVITALSDP